MIRVKYWGGPFDGATATIDDRQFPPYLSIEIVHLTDFFLHTYHSHSCVDDVVNSLPEGEIPTVEVFHSGVDMRHDRIPFLEKD